ncbi:hypothetical protein B9Z19DRAFT_1130105 [Tuber borchii]|uniref:Diphosphomevalonate decarboxylase-like N-terminal domain-containing protein n=1 Tax=Tuber borchii TaxID=42251 RepID=A0A2T6ZKZ3_TUBBO|nr:hypothetical protein B9Z19DRAFT_1130105 [Tuber borchii]
MVKLGGSPANCMLHELKILRKNHEDTNPFLRRLSRYMFMPFPRTTSLQQQNVARQGSGSGCRGLFGGYVPWEMGQAVDGSDSYPAKVAPASHWPDMKSVNPAAPAAKKVVCSTAYMQAIA